MAVLALLLTLSVTSLAVEPRERLADPVLEARARELSRGLRCLVCQNESIDDSNADLAHDVRMLLRERLMTGDTDSQIIKFITDRYGTFVLLKPPLELATYVLWFGPAALMVMVWAAIGLTVWRRRSVPKIERPLDADEQMRLELLLREDGS